MKVIIAGSRNWTNADIIANTMAKFPHKITEIVSGVANGADKLGEIWAEWKSIPVKRFLTQQTAESAAVRSETAPWQATRMPWWRLRAMANRAGPTT